ncbi:fimbrial biogenesis chaperone [Microbulbifer pacificus]|uniref:Pili assembly chaperone N-terminal domain-containing protein n=1 Tax=Microbulbifer pacificus TaxID=407164 RepID=A0AAU0N416_9GAMM|nr:fimbria/pilus periplasmic chaperone [Microbulbifer pacificus]WOX07115.1 hypothetical protein R5R33_08270 [Microbulbifer pacificus]
MLARIFQIAAGLLLVGILPFALAQSVSPTRVQINLDNSPQAILTLSSVKPVDVAIEFSVLDYSAAFTDMVAPLEVIPPQILLRPGETKQVMVRWRGSSTLQRSASYYLAIDELPLAVKDREVSAAIQLLTTLRLPIHVHANGEAELAFSPPQIDGSASLEFYNTGAQYALLSHYEIGVTHDREVILFDGIDFARLLNRDAILPGQMVSIPLRLIGLDAAGLQGARLVRKE